jgi:hypothetical protein
MPCDCREEGRYNPTVFDLLIAIISASTTVLLAYIGITVSLHAPKKNDVLARARLKRKVLLVAGFSIVLITFQAYRNNATINSLLLEEQNHINTTVELADTGGARGTSQIAPGKWLVVNTYYKIRHNEAKDFVVGSMPIIEDGPVNETQSEDAWQTYWNSALNTLQGHAGISVSKDGDAKTSSGFDSPLSKESAEGLKAHTKFLYIISTARWKNVSGTESQLSFCEILLRPEYGYVPEKNAAIINCPTPSPR